MKLYDLVGAGPGFGDRTGYSWSSALDKTESQISQRENSRTPANDATSIVNKAVSSLTGEKYSVVGINVNQIDNMREAIRQYVSEIKNHLDGIEPLANADNAYKSEEVQRAVRDYISKVKQYCLNLTSQLLAFSDQLVEVKYAYLSKMSNIASDFNQKSTSFSEGTAYTESAQ